MARKKEHTPEELAKARYLYEQTLAPVDDIAAMLGMSKTPFYKRVRDGQWARRRASEATYQFVRAVTDAAPPTIAADAAAQAAAAAVPERTPEQREQARLALADRILRTAEREMDAIERVLAQLDPEGQAEADRTSRTLAGIARTLREITALNTPEKTEPAHVSDDDTLPIDIDDLRCELARRINGLVAAERAKGELGRDAICDVDEGVGG